MAEFAIEEFGFAAFQIQVQALLSMFSEGKLTATVLDSGDSLSYVVPCVQGFILKHLIKRIPLAGRKITEYLTKLLFLRGYAFNSSADFETVRDIKEKLCFVSKTLKNDRKLAEETVCFEEEYELPDGKTIMIGKERFEAPEVLFDPSKGGYEIERGLGDLVFHSIRVIRAFILTLTRAQTVEPTGETSISRSCCAEVPPCSQGSRIDSPKT